MISIKTPYFILASYVFPFCVANIFRKIKIVLCTLFNKIYFIK